MAEAIARSVGGNEVQAFSAGLHPMGRVAEGSLMALGELGHSTEGLRSKGLNDIDLDSMDLIVSLMGPEGLSPLPRRLCADKIAWGIPDPYGEDDESYLAVAALLEKKISSLISSQRVAEPFSL